MKYKIIIATLLICNLNSFAQLAFPFDFETNTNPNPIDPTNMNAFGTGATIARVANPAPDAWNSSSFVVRHQKGTEQWSGMEFPNLTAAFSTALGTQVCFDYWTTAPVGTPILFKMNGNPDINSITTRTSEWANICYTVPNGGVMPVIIFRLGDAGTTAPDNIIYVDNINQYTVATAPFQPDPECETAIDASFCPTPASSASIAVVDGGGDYDWYTSPLGGVPVLEGSDTYNTPAISVTTSYYVLNTDGTFIPRRNAVPTVPPGPFNGFTEDWKIEFTSNMSGGLFYGMDWNQVVIGAPPPACNYTMVATNINTGISETIGPLSVGTVDNTNHSWTFPSPLAMNYGDQIEVTMTSITGPSCYLNTHSAPPNTPTTANGEITFTGHEANTTPGGALTPDGAFSGFNFDISGTVVPRCSRTEVVATADPSLCSCLTPINATFCNTPAAPVSLSIVDGGGVYNWHSVSTGGSILAGGTNTTTFITPNLSATTSYWVEEVGGTCGGEPRTEVIAIADPSVCPCLTPIHDTLCLTTPASASLAVVDGGGDYYWYTHPTTGTPATSLNAGSPSPTYTTPVIGATTSYWVEEGASGTTYTNDIIGPTPNAYAYSVGNPAWWGRQVFISNFDDGATFNEVTMVNRIAGTTITQCDWEVCVTNLTQDPGGASQSCAYVNNLTANTPGSIGVFNFADVSMNNGDEIEVDFVNLDPPTAPSPVSGCAVTPVHLGTYDNYPNTSDPEVTWTEHRNGETGLDDNRFLGYDYKFSGTMGGAGGPCTGEARTEVIAVDGNCVLSVDNLVLDANKTTKGVLLEWSTNSEFDYFEVTKSEDGINFQTIDLVYKSDNESEFSFLDTDIENNKMFYQVIQQNKNGTEFKTNIEEVELNLENLFNIYPNPTTNSFTISSNIENKQNIQIKLLDAIGREVIFQNLNVDKGVFNKKIDISSISVGLYTLQIITVNNKKTIKLIKE